MYGATEGGGLQSAFELGATARSLGMGGAGAAVGDDGSLFLKNPAVLGWLGQKEISTFHASLFVDTLYDAIGYVHPFYQGTVGASVARTATTDIPRTVNFVAPLGTFDAEQWQGALGFGTRILGTLSVGAGLKFRRMSIDDHADSGIGADAGILYRLSRNMTDLSRIGYKNLSLGLAFSNVLSPEIRLDANGDRPPLILRPALAYHIVSKSMTSSLWLAGETEVIHNGGNSVKAGLEYGWRQRFFARGGWDGNGPTAGGGIAYRGVRFDYAFSRPDLGTSHRFSLSYRFGRLTDTRQSQRLQTLKAIAKTYEDAGEYNQALNAWKKVLQEFPGDPEALEAVPGVERKRKKTIETRLEKARKAMAANDIPTAVPEITLVLNLDPGNKEARALMKQMDLKLLISQNYMQGLEAYQAGDYATAVKFLDMVRETDPLYRDTARLYSDAKSRLTPLESLPKDVAKLYAEGVSRYMKGDYQKAIEVWQKALAKLPGHYLIQRNIADAMERLKVRAESKPTPAPPKETGRRP